MSQAVARITMIWFDKKIAEKCKGNSIEIVFYKRYVDDGNMMVITPEENQREIEIRPEIGNKNTRQIEEMMDS